MTPQDLIRITSSTSPLVNRALRDLLGPTKEHLARHFRYLALAMKSEQKSMREKGKYARFVITADFTQPPEPNPPNHFVDDTEDPPPPNPARVRLTIHVRLSGHLSYRIDKYTDAQNLAWSLGWVQRPNNPLDTADPNDVLGFINHLHTELTKAFPPPKPPTKPACFPLIHTIKTPFRE